MTDRVYTDPKLAAVYDSLNPFAAWHQFFLDCSAESAEEILDVGCGTGMLACEMARRGHRVTGVEPAPAMLAVARARPGSDRVVWVDSDAAGFQLESRFDLITITGHAFQTFHSDEYAIKALTNLRRHLKPAGRIVFDTRNPSVREWLEWVPGKSHERVEVPGIGQVEVFNSIAADNPPFVTFMTHFKFPDGETRQEPATLRFIAKDHLEKLLAASGLSPVSWLGDYNGNPWKPASMEIITIATRATA